ncbi:anthranilate phosphoribosyltransferase [compost metagenome]
MYNPEVFGGTLNAQDLTGGETIAESATIFMNVLNTECTLAQQKAVLANSAMSIKCLEEGKTLEECYAIAEDSLLGKKALDSFKKLLNSQPVTA